MKHIIYYILWSIILGAPLYTLTTSIEIINDTQYAFLISDHQSQAIIILPEQSQDFELDTHKSIYLYAQHHEKETFKLLYAISKKNSEIQSLQLFTSAIISQNFLLLYSAQFLIQTPIEIQKSIEQKTITSKPIIYPQTEQETQNFLTLIQQQQQAARQNFQNNFSTKPTRSPSEDMAHKIAAVTTLRQNQNLHQFARSSRRN